jgi:hypothetical protein
MFKRLAVAVAMASAMMAPAAFAKETCVKKAGEGWGVTRGIAEFQSYEIILQVTGNWPFQTDKVSKPVYDCKGSTGNWTCVARAIVCKKA